MAQYSVFGPRTFGSPSVDDFLSPQSGEEGSNFETDYTMDSSADSAVTRGGRTGSIMQKPTVSPAKSNANQQILDGAVEEERVRDASLLILPLLLANPPMLPSHLKSAEVRQRHQMLSISPNDVDDYLVTSFPSAPEDLKSEVIAGLDQLKNSVEQLAGILATDTDAMEHIVRKVRWASPEPGNIQANIFLGDDAADTDAQDGGGGGALCLILKHEEDTGGGRRANREPWRFHNLLPFGGAPGAWFDDLARAQKRPAPAPPAKPAGLSVQWKDRSIDSNGRSRSLTSNATTRTAGSYNTADEGETDQENVAGDAPEDKFTSADDFWGGWDDGEGGEKEESREVINKGAGAEDDEDDEEAYWASYDASDPHADRLRRDAEEAERQKMADLDNVSQMGSVNFDGLERRMDHSDFYAVGAGSTLGADEPIQEEADDGQEEQSHTGDAQMASDSPRRSIDEVPPPLDSGSLPSVAYESVQKMIDAEQQQQQDTQDSTQERSGALSPRSDATSMGLTDEGEQITADNTTVDIEELDRGREAAGKPEPQDDDHRDEMQQQDQDVEPAEKEVTAEEQEERKAEDDVGVAEPMRTPQIEAPPSPTRDPAAATPMPHSPRKARNKMIGIEHLAVAQSRQRKKSGTSHGDVYPPAPMSVSAQSVFETPSDMSLADLEAFYRNRDHQRMVEAKERLSRMHRESRESMRDSTGPPHKHRSERSKAGRDDADDDDDEEEHDSDIVSEAESALEAVMSEYASAPSRPGTTQAHSDLHEDADEQEQEQEEGQSEKDDGDDAADKQRARSSSNVAQTSAATQSAATRSDADPLEALSQADPMLAFNAEDSNVGEEEGEEDEEAKRKRNRGRVPMTREVSMGTLRRLAEENELKSEEAKRARGDMEDASSTTTGLSKAGGFKNFLQLAPSTVATDLDSEEPILDEDYAEPHALPAAIDEEEEGALSEEADERHDQEQENDMSEQAAEAAQVPVPASTLGDVDNQRLAAPGLDDRQPGDDDEDHGGAENAASAALSAFAADPNATPRPRDSGGWGKEANKRDENEGIDDREQEEEEGGGNQDEYDLDAFMFPDQHKKNRLDSPGLSDNDPLAREAFGIITGRGGGGGSGAKGRLSPSNFRVPNNRASTSGGAAPSDSFLPGAASDASVRPLLGSIAGRGRSDESGNTGVTGNTGISRALHARGVLDPRRIVEEGNEDEGEGQEEESQGQEDGANEQQPQEPQDEEGEQSFDSQATPRAQHQPPRVNRGGATRSSKAGESGARSPTSNMATQGNSSANATTSRPSRPATSRNASTDRVLGAASTSTDLGLAEIADDRQSEKYSVAPGPHWIGAAPPPGSTSQHTANLRHQYLRAQRQQALESQRERMGQKPGRAASGDDDEEAPLARGAQQRQPFPPADRGRGGPRGRGGRGRGVRGPPLTRRTPSTGAVKRVKEINGIPASAAVAVGPTDEDEAEDEQQREEEEEEEEEEDNAARALYDQVKDLARDGDGIDDDEEEDENRDGEDQDDMDEDGDVGGQDELADQDRGQDQQEDQGDEQGGESDEGEENEDSLDAEQRDINGDAGPPSPALRHKSSAHSFSRHSDPQGRPPLPSPAALAPPSPGTPSTSLDPSRAPFTRPNLNQRQQPDRLHASQAAQRRRRALKALQRRNGHVQALLRSVVAVINDQGAEDDLEAGGSAGVLPMLGESDFLRLAREAFRECERMKDERIANGAGGRGGEVGLSGRDVMGGKAKGVVMGGQAAMDDDGQDDEEYEVEMPLAMGEEEDNGDEYDDQEEGEGEGDEAAGGAMPQEGIMAI